VATAHVTGIDIYYEHSGEGRRDSELRVYEGGHVFFLQDRRAITEILDFLDLP
jgi:hypothetical protein